MYYLLFLTYFSKIQFVNGGYGATVTPAELKFYLRMSKATVHRYIRIMVKLRYIERVSRGNYTLSSNAGSQTFGFNTLLPMDYFSQKAIIEEIILDELDIQIGNFT